MGKVKTRFWTGTDDQNIKKEYDADGVCQPAPVSVTTSVKNDPTNGCDYSNFGYR